MDTPHITGDWRSDDQSEHRIEVAPTDLLVGHDGQQHTAVALRDTSAPDQVIFCTPDQIRKFTQAASARGSNVQRVLELATSGPSGR